MSVNIWEKEPLFHRLGHNEKTIQRVLRLCLNDLPELINELLSVLKQGDLARSKDLAHTIKGVAANVGAEELRQLAAEIEVLMSAGSTAEALERGYYLVERFEPLRSQLAYYLDSLIPARPNIPEQSKILEQPKNEQGEEALIGSLITLIHKLQAAEYVQLTEVEKIHPLFNSDEQILYLQVIDAIQYFDSQQALKQLAKLTIVAKLKIDL